MMKILERNGYIRKNKGITREYCNISATLLMAFRDSGAILYAPYF